MELAGGLHVVMKAVAEETEMGGYFLYFAELVTPDEDAVVDIAEWTSVAVESQPDFQFVQFIINGNVVVNGVLRNILSS